MLDSVVSNFHFLRPQWLWALVPVLGFSILLSRRLDPEKQWRRLIAPHLLSHLRIGAQDGLRLRPIHLVTMVALLATLGVAGPTWDREISPFAQDTAPLVIALDVSQSMNAVDVQPTRLERAKQKIRDLLALRPGSRTALIAYAGSAHMVLPLSDDPTMFEAFLDGLDIDVMPIAGKEPAEALGLAETILARDSVPGSILFLTDGIAPEHIPSFVRHGRESNDGVMVLALGTTEGGPVRTAPNQFATDAQGLRIVATLDREGLEALADLAGVFVGGATVDDEDVERVQRRILSHLRVVQQDDPTARWKDFGYYLVYPIALLALFWFRRGWTVRWGAALIVLSTVGCAPESGPQIGFANLSRLGFSELTRFADLWLTPDQQGRYLFERGRYSEAGDRFADFTWAGTARYRAGDMDGAILAFARVDSPEAHFALGNAYARIGSNSAAVESNPASADGNSASIASYQASIASYDRALALRPEWTEASENRDLVQSLLPPPEDEEEEEQGGDPAPPPSFDPDDIQIEEDEIRGERGEVDGSLLDEDQLTEMWMRRLQTSPGEFLRRRFAIERAEREAAGAGGGR